MMNLSFSLSQQSRLLSLPERIETSAHCRTGGSRGRAVRNASQAWGAVLTSGLGPGQEPCSGFIPQAQEDDMVGPIK